MIRKIRKACRAAGTQIKQAAKQPLKETPELDPTEQSAAGRTHERGDTPAKPNHDLADLVWKYFSEQITQAVIEVQQTLAQEPKGSSPHSGPRKG